MRLEGDALLRPAQLHRRPWASGHRKPTRAEDGRGAAEDGGARRRAKSTEIRDAYAEKPLFEREGSVRLFGVRLLDFYEVALTRSAITSEMIRGDWPVFGLRIAPDRESPPI